MLPPRRQARSVLATATKKAKAQPSPDNLESLASARRDYAAAALDEYIRRTVDAAPPLTAEQRDRLSLLLSRGGDAA